VLDLHGFSMDAGIEDTHTRLRTLAPPRGLVVIQPSAPGATWNPDGLGPGRWDAGVWTFVTGARDTLRTDPDRLHVTGFSQGAMLALRLVCAHADELASVAATAGMDCFGAGAAPAREVPILYVHGRMDAVVPWALASGPFRAALLATWPFGAPEEIASGPRHRASRLRTTGGTDLELWEHDLEAGPVLGGHCLPGPPGPGPYRCADSTFDLTEETLRFFASHPRRGR
jgi:polyhydroxybutyrate depolymerase